jgi:hypothetical protein
MDDANEKFFTVHSPTRITLSADALDLARQNNMTPADMAKHLLAQHKLRETGSIQKDGHN